MKILAANWQADDDADIERAAFPDARIHIARGAANTAAVLDPALCATVDAVINYSPTLPVAAPPDAFPKARIAVRSGVGYDNIDAAGWAARNVPACNVPDYGTTEVADHALALMLVLTRGTDAYVTRLRNGAPGAWHFGGAPVVRRHRGATFGIIGLGRIGLAAARRAAAFDMRVLFHDPHLSNGVDLSTGYERVDTLADLMARADVLSVHAPLDAQSRGMLGQAAFAAARPGLIVINTARGPIIDLSALEVAMRAGRVAAAGLDVLPHEPADLQHPLIRAWRNDEDWIRNRLIVTPHAAFFSPDAMRDLRLKSIQVVRDYLVGGRLTNCINAHLLN